MNEWVKNCKDTVKKNCIIITLCENSTLKKNIETYTDCIRVKYVVHHFQ